MKTLVPALIAGLLLATLVAGMASAQDGSLTLELTAVTDAGYPNAHAVLTLDDTSSATPPALTKDDIAVTIDGKPAPVSDARLASSETTPLDVVVLVDVSGSMEGRPLALAKEAAKGFVAQLAPQDRVAIVTFANDVSLAQDYTTDHAAAAAVLDGLTAGGNTALYQATAAAAVKIGTSASSRRAIVLLSDGADYGTDGAVSREQAVQAVTSVAAPVFAIGEGTDLDTAYLRQIASATKGRYLEAPDPSQLADLYASVARLLHSQYIVTFDASSVKQAGDVPVAVELKLAGRTATASATYHAPAPPATTITVSGLGQDESITSPREITAEVQGPASGVTFRVDGRDVATIAAAPFVFSYDPAAYGGGDHRLEVVAETPAGAVTSTVDFSSSVAAAGGGGFPLIPVAGGVAVLLAVVGGAAVAWRLRQSRVPRPSVEKLAVVRRMPAVVPPPPEPEPVALEPEVIDEPKGLLVSRSEPDFGAEYIVGGSPVSIGSGEQCAVRVPDRGLSAVEARIWVRSGKLMLHKMTSLNALANEGVTGGWSILDPGDTFELGPHQFLFKLMEEEPAPAPEGDVPDVLRDPERPLRIVPPSPQAAPSRLRLPELMPRDSQPEEPDQRAS